jgi:hypothetical protein
MKCITSIQPRPLLGNRFRSTWVHPRFLVRFVLLDLEFHVYVSRWLFVLLYFFLCPLCCVFFCLRILITSLLFTDSDYLFVVYGFWLPLLFTDSDYLFVVYGFWLPLCCLRILITSLLFTDSDYLFVVYGFWLPLCCLRILITSLLFTDSDYLFVVYGFWLPLCCLRIQITSLLSSNSNSSHNNNSSKC